MDTKYTVIPKNSYVELQVHNDSETPIHSRQTHLMLLPRDDSESPKGSSSENAKILDGNADDFDVDSYELSVSKPNQGSGIYGAVFNLTTTVVGAGIMALPATMKVLGLVLGIVLIIVMGILSEISVEMLIRYSVLSKSSTYGEVVQCALGKTAKVLSEICIIVNNAGIMVVYLIIIGDVMSGSPHHKGVFDQLFGHGVWDQRRLVILAVLAVFLAPLCVLNKIDSLTVTSGASVLLAVVFVLVCFVVAFIKLIEGTIEAPRLTPDFGSKTAILNLLVVIPIMTNAYVCHFNVQPIYNELEARSPQKMNHVGRITTVLCIGVYASTAISGYLLFGKDTEADVLTNFDTDLGVPYSNALDYIVRVGYVFHLVLVFPVIHFSLRQTVHSLVFEGAPPLSESRKRSLVLTTVLLGVIYFGSTMVPNIWTAFKFTGATAAVSLGFIFPPLIALRLGHLGEGLTFKEKFFSLMMLIMAVVVGIIGVIGNVYSLNSRSE